MADRDGRVVIDIEGDSSGFQRELDSVDGSAQKLGSVLAQAGGKLGDALKTAAAIGVAAIGTAATAAAGLAKQATDAYAEYEQLSGGVETLFGDAMDSVMQNAQKAFETAGLSMNEYMETATSSAAAMISSLGGDQAKAAKLTDTAIRDMSDNANKMGTSMEAIQNAYAGFSKQNYTMLDNLKLGYGGTKAEMQRLLDDAKKISGIEYNIDSYADVVAAIHEVQTSMRISGLSAEEAAEMVRKGQMTEEQAFEAMGTTAKEAASTISGSIAMAGAAWQNILVGIADDTQDLDGLIDTFVASAVTAVDNFLPRFGQAIGGVGKMVQGFSKVLPDVVGEIAGTLPHLTGAAVSAGEALLGGVSAALPQIVPVILSALGDITEAAVRIVPQIGRALMQSVGTVLSTLANNSGSIQSFFSSLLSDISAWITAGAGTLFSPKAVKAAVNSVNGIVKALASAFKTLLPKAVETAASIVSELSAALVNDEVINTIIDSVSDVIQTIAGMLTDGSTLPTLIEAAVNVVAQLCEALASSAVILVDAAIQIIDGFLTFLLADDNLTKLIDGAFKIVEAIANGLLDSMDALVAAAVEIIGKLVGYFTDPENLGKLTDAAIAIVSAIGSGIVSLAGNIWSAAGEIVNKIGEWFSNPQNVESLKESGKAILNRIGEGLLTIGERLRGWFSSMFEEMKTGLDNISWHELGEKIITSVLDFGKNSAHALADIAVWWWDFFENLGSGLAAIDWGDLGRNILDGIMQGMLNLANGGSWLWEKISTLGSGIVDGFKAYFGIASPSKLMADQIGQYIPQGIAVGIEADSNIIDRQLNESLRALNLGEIQASGLHLPPIDLTGAQVSGAAFTSPVRESTQAAQSNGAAQLGGDIIIPVQIGGETLETVVISAIQLANARSGGRTV